MVCPRSSRGVVPALESWTRVPEELREEAGDGRGPGFVVRWEAWWILSRGLFWKNWLVWGVGSVGWCGV